MKIKTITYRRVKNLGNYESKAIEVSAELGEKDDPDRVLEDLESWVNKKLFPPLPPQPSATKTTAVAAVSSEDEFPF